jgi:hypothetical protein
MDRKVIFDADGMSGGAVFYLGEKIRKDTL